MRSFLDNQTLYSLCCTLSLPYLNYCSEIWGHTYQTHLKQIFTLQKRAFRIVESLNYRDETSKTLKKTKCLKFSDIVKLKSCTYIYKAQKEMLPAR